MKKRTLTLSKNTLRPMTTVHGDLPAGGTPKSDNCYPLTYSCWSWCIVPR